MKKRRLFSVLLLLCMSINLSFPEAYAAEKKSTYPPRVTGVKAVSSGHDSIKLTWKKTSSAKGYKVYRSTKKNGRYKLIKTTKKTSFKNTSLTSNKNYYYKVRAYKTVKNKTYTSKKFSKIVSAKPLLTKATSLKATEKSKSSITLSWKKGTNTKYYAIYRKEGKSGTYKKIKSTSKLSYTDKKLTTGKTYYYKVKAYNKRGDKRQYASFSKYVKIKLSLPVSESTTEITATESTTAETTTTEAATTEPSTAETTTTEVITTVPVIDTTTTDAPTTEPITEPTTEHTTEAPTTEPTTEAPATEPTTEAPTTEPTTEDPTTEHTTEAPATEPTTEAPATEPSAEDYIKPENVEKAKAFADKLHADAISDDYTKMCLPWEQMTRTTNWIYYTGLVFDAFLQTDFDKYHGFMKDFYNQYITDDGKIKTYCTGELDSAMLGAALVEILEKGDLTKTEKERYTNGICYIYNTLQKQTRYPQAGNLWLHSQNADGTPKTAWTKWNICLDGIYMSQIFLIRLTEAIDSGVISIAKADGSLVTSEEIWNDIYSRLSFTAENFRDEETGMLYHGYCVETGETNKAFWSRGQGWYTMVLVEAAEKCPDKEKREKLCGYMNSIMTGIVNHQDSATSLWYNVTDRKDDCVFRQMKENTLIEIYNKPETSGSAMFAYCLLRGYNNGILKDEKFRIAGLKAFNALTETKLTDEGLTDTITSCSVYTNPNNYMASDYTTNDGKGVGPYIMAANYVYESHIKKENVKKADTYINSLYTNAITEDYTSVHFPWDPENRKLKWIYYTGLVFDGLLQKDFDKYYSFMKDFYNQFIAYDGKIQTYAEGELDSAMLGAPLLEIMKKGSLTPEEKSKYQKGISFIYNELSKQTAYPEAGNLLLHSQNADGTPKPYWEKWNICLDGIYMSQIFLIRLTEAIDNGTVTVKNPDGSAVTSEKLWEDIYSRLSFAAENFKDEETGLLRHGYCVETKETNGITWSRGLGWYTMLLVEAAEKIPDKEKREKLTACLESVMGAVIKYQDEKTSLWYNVIDEKENCFITKKTESGEEIIYNIPETSGSAMFSYTLLRGYRNGVLKDDKFLISGLKAFNALTETKLTDKGLEDVYLSSSVTSSKNNYQVNGYITNDGKGVGPYIMAANYVYEKDDPQIPSAKPLAENYLKKENADTAKAYIDKLYTDSKDVDVFSGDFAWQNAEKRSSWIYFAGLTHMGFMTLDSNKYTDEVKEFYLAHIRDDGSIINYATGTLDAILPVVNILLLLESDCLTAEERAKCEKAVRYTYGQLENQVSFPQAGDLYQHGQNPDGTPVAGWTKWRVCLDGVYMSQMFLMTLSRSIDSGKITITDKNGQTVTSKAIWDGVYKRLTFVFENMRDEKTGLIYHGYDVDTKETNGVFWSRSLGWYAMALMEAADTCPDPSYKKVLSDYFSRLMKAITDWQDEDSSLWYNVINKREEVYLEKNEKTIRNITETSGSSMFAYCLLRGYDSNLLTDKYRIAGLKAYNALVETKLTEEGLQDVCLKSAVYTSPAMYQVFDYVPNDGKAVGPFIMATKYVY